MQITNSVVCGRSKGCIYKQIKPPLVDEHAFPLMGFVCQGGSRYNERERERERGERERERERRERERESITVPIEERFKIKLLSYSLKFQREVFASFYSIQFFKIIKFSAVLVLFF